MRSAGDQLRPMTTAEMRLDEGKAAGLRASAQFKARFSTSCARAQRDLPLRGSPDKAIITLNAPASGECRLTSDSS
jgi:hypothetical protein